MAPEAEHLLDVHGLALVVQDHPGLGQVEIQRATASARLAKRLREPVEDLQRTVGRLVDGRVAREDPLHLFVRQPLPGADHGALEALLLHPSALVHDHEQRHCQPVLLRHQRAGIRGKSVGQHRDDAVHQIHAGAAAEGLQVQR